MEDIAKYLRLAIRREAAKLLRDRCQGTKWDGGTVSHDDPSDEAIGKWGDDELRKFERALQTEDNARDRSRKDRKRDD